MSLLSTLFYYSSFHCDYFHCSAKERVSKYQPLVVEAFCQLGWLRKNITLQNGWNQDFFFLWYLSPKHALFQPHCNDVFLTSIKASIVLSKFYGISREFSLAVLVNWIRSIIIWHCVFPPSFSSTEIASVQCWAPRKKSRRVLRSAWIFSILFSEVGFDTCTSLTCIRGYPHWSQCLEYSNRHIWHFQQHNQRPLHSCIHTGNYLNLYPSI